MFSLYIYSYSVVSSAGLWSSTGSSSCDNSYGVLNTSGFKNLSYIGYDKLYGYPINIDKEVKVGKKSGKREELDKIHTFAAFVAEDLKKWLVRHQLYSNISLDTRPAAAMRGAVVIGSSRGATALLEARHERFRCGEKLPANTSPLTTLGNISSYVAQLLKLDGIAIDCSVTCSTSLHAFLIARGLLASEDADFVVVGASEAPLTPFTIAQMNAIGVYSQLQSREVSQSNNSLPPARPFNIERQNTLTLGEAAAIFVVSKHLLPDTKPLAKIVSIGCALEVISSPTAIDIHGAAFEKAIRGALDKTTIDKIDLYIAHAPGTVKGDQAELNGISRVVQLRDTTVTSTKWATGHTFAVSGAVSLAYALKIMSGKAKVQELPYQNFIPESMSQIKNSYNNALVVAAGFGGNQIALLVELVK